jgi:gliding motility-associated-like protein
VKVVETIAVPNAFTPNGDGRNDTWQIPYIESYPGFVVQVYNRYGQLVYRSNNGVVNWDGTINGKPQDAGTYVYVFDQKQFGGISRGTILLIR